MSNNKRVRFRYLNDERNRGSVMKVLNDFLVDIMGAIIPGFLFIFSFGIALGVPIILIYDISIPKSFYNSIFSFGAIILILLLSYVIGHAFYRADINEPDKASIAKKMKIHIKEVCKECEGNVEQSSSKPEGPSEEIPDDIIYRMKHLHIDRKYIDSSRDKSIKHYVSKFYSKLISDESVTPNVDNTDDVFYIIKNHFDGINCYKNLSNESDELKDIATRSDYFNLIDILSDCIEYVVNCYLKHMEYFVTHLLRDKEQWSIVLYLQVFFREIKYIDYCDNYGEYKYLLSLIQQLKKISFTAFELKSIEDKSIKQKTVEYFCNEIEKFSEKLYKYKTNILDASGVKETIIKDYNQKIFKNKYKYAEKKINKLKEQDNNKDYSNDTIKIIEKLQYDLLLYASIRRMQNEEGTPHKDSGGFPYINYENYLFKRNLHHLAEMVNWNYREGRTKNQINRYKIKIQLFCPDAYGVLNKNESHVRMASSSWFASKFLIWTNFVIILLLVAIQYPLWKDGIKGFDSFFQLISPLIPPLSVAVLLCLLKRKIEDFIHYQRLREIYFALYTYHECKNEIKYKEEYYSHCLFLDNGIRNKK